MKTASIHLPQSRQRSGIRLSGLEPVSQSWLFKLSAREINSKFDIEGIYTGSIFLKSNQTTSVEIGKMNPSLKFKDNFGGLALLSDWFRAEFYHILSNNPASFL